MTRRLSSRDNPLLRQLVRIVESSRERRQLGVSFIEGVHLCAAYLARVGRPRLALVTPDARMHPEVMALLGALARHYHVSCLYIPVAMRDSKVFSHQVRPGALSTDQITG